MVPASEELTLQWETSNLKKSKISKYQVGIKVMKRNKAGHGAGVMADVGYSETGSLKR